MTRSPRVLVLSGLLVAGSGLHQTRGATGARQFFSRGDQVFPSGWSAAGELVVTVVEAGQPSIWIVSATGAAVEQIRGPNPQTWASGSSPDGRTILSESYVDGVADLFTIDRATGRFEQITATPWNEWHPSWSPDGTRMVVDSDSGGRGPRLYQLDRATGRWSRLTTGTRPEQGASWSPNGRRLAFHREVGPARYDIVVIDRVTRDEIQVTDGPGDNNSATWSPDGQRLVFSSNRAGPFDLYVACRAGTMVRRITDGPGDKKYPHWSPDGRRIAYQRVGDGVWVTPDPAGDRCPA